MPRAATPRVRVWCREGFLPPLVFFGHESSEKQEAASFFGRIGGWWAAFRVGCFEDWWVDFALLVLGRAVFAPFMFALCRARCFALPSPFFVAVLALRLQVRRGCETMSAYMREGSL